MKVYKFINSSLIAKALEENEYKFSAFDCACLIKQSYKTTLTEKQDAWKEIIETMPNETIKVSNRKSTLHDYLRALINLQNELLNEFYNRTHDYEYEQAALKVLGNDKPGKYTFEYIYKDCSLTRAYKTEVSFSDYKACMEYINNDDEKENYESGDLVRYEITSCYKGETIRVITNRKFEVIDMEYYGYDVDSSTKITKQNMMSYLSNFIIRVEDNIAL